MSSSHNYSNQQNHRHASSTSGMQHDGQRYSSQQMPYPASSYPAQPGTYPAQTLSTTTHGYPQQPGSYPVAQSASYPGAAVYSELHQVSVNRSVSAPGGGQQYATHGAQPMSGSQYVGHHQQAAYPAAQYSYTHDPTHSPQSSRFPPSSIPAVDRHGRRPSAPASHVQSPPSPDLERFPCNSCDKTFSRAHDRKRHYETQHSVHPPVHKCVFCRKEFSRADSLKRHLDNGCEKDPSFAAGASA